MPEEQPTSLWLRVVRLPWLVVRPVYRWIRGAPRYMQVALLLGVFGGVAFGGYVLNKKLTSRRIAEASRKQWERFEGAVKQNNTSEMKLSLQGVLEAEPGNPLATTRLKSLETLDADPSDEAMVYLTMRLALQQQKLGEASREAQKRLKVQPKDWFSRCIVALDCLQRGDATAANAQLDELPEPGNPVARVQPGGLLLAFRLFRALNRDTTPLRQFVESQVALVIRNPNLANLGTPEKTSLVECLLEGVDPRSDRLHANLVQSWAPTTNLLNTASDEALQSADVLQLAALARMAPKLDLFLRQLVRDGAIQADQAKVESAELETRTRKLWNAVQEREPLRAEAYRGEALSYLRQNEYAKAKDAVVRGISKVAEDAELLALFSRMLQLEGKAEVAYASLMEAAQKQPEQAITWLGLAAEAAIAANRRDLALEACQQMRKVKPNHSWATRTEALLWLDADQPQKALELFQTVGINNIVSQPLLARAYARALATSQKQPELQRFFDDVEKRDRESNKPAVVIGALIGWQDATAKLQQGEWAKLIADKSERLLEIWPEEQALMRVRAEARLQAARYGSPVWELPRVRMAIQACERVRAALPEEYHWSLALAELHSLGEKNPSSALRALGQPVPTDRIAQMSVAEVTLVGRVLRENQKYPEALKLLETASRSREAPAGTFIQLALTLQQMGRTVEARNTLRVAQPMPRTTQEQEDYITAAKLIVQ